MKYYIISIFILGLAFLWLMNLKSLPKEWQTFVDNIDNDFQGYKTLEKLCTDIGGRLSGTSKGKQTEEFVTNLLKSYGYQNIIEDKFKHTAWQRENCILKLLQPFNKSITAYSLGMTPEENHLQSQIIDVNYGIPKNYGKLAPEMVKGKIVLIDMKTPVEYGIYHRVDKIQLAVKNGAMGAILYNSMFGNVISVGTASFDSILEIPAISISREDGLAVKNLLHSKESVMGEIIVKNEVYTSESTNIGVEIAGIESNDEMIIICAHLDAWDVGQGAIDNGSSVAILLELARQFKLQNIQTKRKIRFLFFMAEEFGLLGSNHYVQSEIAQLDNIIYLINLEMNLAPIGINLMLDDRNRDWFELLTEKLQSLGMQKQVITNPWLESDHTPFMMKGIPVLTFVEKTNIFSNITYHSNQDNIEFIIPEDLKNSVKIIGIVLKELANTSDIQKYRISKEHINQKMKQFGLYKKRQLRKMNN